MLADRSATELEAAYFKDLALKNVHLGLKAMERLDRHTSFKVGGPAALFGWPKDLEELRRQYLFAREHSLNVFFLGGGTNVLFSDEGYLGLVLKLEKGAFKESVFLTKEGDGIPEDAGFFATLKEGDELVLRSGAGAGLSELARLAASKSLSGMEDLAGIPGRLGGAVNMNAGAGERQVGDLVAEAEIMDEEGEVKSFGRNDLAFGYRAFKSPVKEPLITSARLRLVKAASEGEVVERMTRRLSVRKISLPVEPSAGSFFKNPPQKRAGELIEEAGFKGRKEGGAMVSMLHANILINLGKATFKDVSALARNIEEEVERRFGIKLEREARMVDFAGGVNV
ncbi:MAG: UDP-N-acetylmuramate dehydrogenase [Deltaproteobacteria bacterium]|jgi:UDP-N-acetylmuramate dehydrogenase|nr:UDP-N-acetylmuramate dehydrogenase [Deltaproteobacteria bacterium]